MGVALAAAHRQAHRQAEWLNILYDGRLFTIRFVDMTFFELYLNTLVLISQANLLYLHTPYTMGS